MTKNREKAIQDFLNNIDSLAPGNPNVEIYRKYFASLSNDQFEELMQKLKSGELVLSYVSPNFSNYRLDVERNLDIGKNLGHSFFQRIWRPSENGLPEYLTPESYLVLSVPVRRASQMLVNKTKLPDNTRIIDQLSYQPTGPSKGAKISYIETALLSSIGVEDALVEVLKYRGGDKGGYQAMNSMIGRYGTARLEVLQNYSTGVESLKTLRSFLTAMHLRSTL